MRLHIQRVNVSRKHVNDLNIAHKAPQEQMYTGGEGRKAKIPSFTPSFL